MDLEKYSEKLEDWADKELKKIEGSIRFYYRQLVNVALGELGKIYADYEDDGVLTYESMIKYDRLKKFIDSLNEHVDTMSIEVQNSISTHLAESYVYSYSWMGWAIENEARRNLQYSSLKVEQIRAALDNPVKGLTLSQTLEKNRSDIIYKIQQDVTQSLVRGSSYKDMAESLKGTFEGDYEKAIRVARTETHRVREQGALDSAKRANQKGILMLKKWRNMKDSRVRKKSKANHIKMDGMQIPVDDLFDLGNGESGIAPGNTGYAHHDINCRCLLVYEIEDVQGQTNDDLAKRTFEDFKNAMDNDSSSSTEVKKRASNVIPNIKNAKFIDQKLTYYALDKNHPTGGPKAVLFDDLLGYNQSNWKHLKDTIMKQLPDSFTNSKGHNGHGETYESILNISGPSGRSAFILTGWIVKDNTDTPTLTTAYIIEEKKAKKKMEDD
ncbi:phage head morphogenesis protein [Lysinibacillus sp. CD3-6]|uniref:DUF6883 domain-containing protein n=1 Tax=Lysinibacillus sp. CD3-6 TaxID=2892541 RepID=UPI001567D190|nr:DUF6883 domain-containing protein [Lysinibacillus sp. CD3-6]UED81072.1 phage head morphogenesis protein [Lysinibacillus sp. CD3-6]